MGSLPNGPPLRVEKKLQPKFGALMDGLNIELDNFVGPTSSIATYPQYDLKTSEQNLDALGLLRRGTLLIMGGRIGLIVSPKATTEKCEKKLNSMANISGQWASGMP